METNKKRKILKILFIIAAIGLLYTSNRFIKAEAAYTDFDIIHDEILIGYSGDGGNVVIPDGIKEIDSSAFFDRSDITGIEIPNSVVRIGDSAFTACVNLKTVNIPDSVTYIGNGTFCNCINLVSIEIPNSITRIGDSAFTDCHSLKTINIPDSVTYIGDSAFAGCANLSEIQVDKNNPNYISVDGILFNKSMTELLQYPALKETKEYSIPSGVTKIGSGAFGECKNLEKVKVPASVTDIGNDFNTFGGSTLLTDIQVDKNNPNYISSDGVLFNKNKDKLLQYPAGKKEKVYNIPSGVTYIGYGAFSGCTGLNAVVVPDTVTSIDSFAFYRCSSLTGIAIPDSVKEMDVYITGLGNDVTFIDIPGEGNNIFFGTSKDFKIYCHADSYAYNFAQNHNYKNALVDGDITTAMYKELGLEKQGKLSLKKKKMVLWQGQKSKIKITSKLNTAVIYKSLNKSIAVVSKKGVVTAKKKGKTTIIVNANGKKCKVKITVKSDTLTIKLSKDLKLPKTKVTIKKGEKLTIKKVSGISGKVTFKSLDKKIASVSVKGVVKAKKRGRTTILIKVKNKTLKLKVTVKR